MAIPGPFSITYGALTVGADSPYQLHGPYILDRSFERLRVTFDVVITADSIDVMQDRAAELESAFRMRDQTLTINLSQDFSDDARWTFAFGNGFNNSTATAIKTGNPDTDKGLSRSYTCTVEGDLPADDQGGLRELETNVDFSPGRQMTVTMRGVYTQLSSGTTALEQYESEFDARASELLNTLNASATFELVDENYNLDRTQQTCAFVRQYVQLLASQTRSALDDPDIVDHRITFTDTSQHPGDSKQDVNRMRRVIGSYDCSIDITRAGVTLQKTFKDKVKPHLTKLFQEFFKPQVFALEDAQVSYDETSKMMSVKFQFYYQKQGGSAVVEVAQSVAFRENQRIDYTPVHDEDPLASEADVGWAILERIWNRNVVVVGAETPKLRIVETARKGPAGLFDEEVAGQIGPDQGNRGRISPSGWNIVQSTSQATPQWVGDPDGEQVRHTLLTETVVEQFSRKPGQRTSTPIQTAPSSGNRRKSKGSKRPKPKT